ncbi:MAG: DUF2911 domain-containing protein [Flavobacteriaceae bacterium]|nr:DUF2911 domain-containing protein [Flavobacteriaceae bacterium]
MKQSLVLFCLLSCFFAAYSQLRHPKASPLAKLEQEIGLTTIKIEYSRPAMRGRTIFGDLVPWGRIWRVGANASTKFSTSTPLDILGNELATGTYALYAFPYETYWEVVFHKNTAHWGDGRTAYDPAEDAFRARIIPEQLADTQENFLIAFDELTHDSAQMYWQWENTRVVIPISVNTKKVMEAEIQAALSEQPNAQTLYEAARYYQEQDINHRKALSLVDKAITEGGDTYYFHRVRSLLLASLGDYKEAIRSAKISRELANEQGKDEFVRMNDNNIKRWSAKGN